MSKKNFETYLEFNFSSLNLAAFNKTNNKLDYYREQKYDKYFTNNKDLNFEELDKILEEKIFLLEKTTGEFIKDIYLIVQTPQSITIKLSVNKNNEGKKIVKEDATYLIQNAKQQINHSSRDLKILHIIVEKYVLDNNYYEFLPLNKSCNKFSIDIKFICLPKKFIKSFENLFLKHQIYINQFVCWNYIKSFKVKNSEKNICQLGKDIVEGINKQEVVSVPREPKKKGFFEKLFHFFNK